MRKLNRRGFSAVEVILLVVIVGLLGFVGYRVWDAGKTEETVTTEETVQATDETEQEAEEETAEDENITNNSKELSLASGDVSMSMPKSWTKDGIGCDANSAAFGGEENIDSVALLPGEKLRTKYGNGTEYFHINVCVFNGVDTGSPKKWLEGIVGGNFSNEKSSSSAINNYPAFYTKHAGSERGYEEVHYVLKSNDKIVYTYARTYETDKDLPGVGDFRKFEESIKTMVNTITIN